MFTGIVKDLGQIKNLEKNLEGIIFEIKTNLISSIEIDDSVAVNGVCLTAIWVGEESFRAQAVHLTLEKTNLGQLAFESMVNLELALRQYDRLSGHLVLGHVNGVATVIDMSHQGDNYQIWYSLPPEMMKYIAKEGSIALDGISLTVAEIEGNNVLVTIIPHTWNETQVHHLKVGSKVNLEVDSNAVMIGKYLDTLFLNYIKSKGL